MTRRGTIQWLGAQAALLATATSCTCGVPPGIVDACSGEDTPPPSVMTDILFVIDNSSSMQEEQEKVASELAIFIDALIDGPVENDFQVAVITTGVSLNARACTPGSQPRLTRFPEESGRLQLGKQSDGSRNPASVARILSGNQSDLAQQFGFLVRQGRRGSGQEMGFESIRLALSPPLIETPVSAEPPGNLGFLRPGARLLIIIVSDEDDCSDPAGAAVALEPVCGVPCVDDRDCGGVGAYCLLDTTSRRRCSTNRCETDLGRAALEPVEHYIDFLLDLDDGTGSGRKREVYLAVIGAVDGDGTPARCVSSTDEAQGVALRYARAVGLMGPQGFISSICEDGYRESLNRIAELVAASQVIDLPIDPGSGSLIQVLITRATGEEMRCRLGPGFAFEPSSAEAPARLRMNGACELRASDQVKLEYVCAG